MNVRRLSRGIHLVISLGACAAVLSLAARTNAASTKKGVAGEIQNAPAVGAVWAYDWGSEMPSMPAGVEYVPMSWGYWGDTQSNVVKWVNSLQSKGAKEILTFNEPDSSTQAKMTVSAGLQGYSYVYSGPIPAISPACTNDTLSWMQSFMTRTATAGENVPAIAVHDYQSNASSILNNIAIVYNLYRKPLWITEFAPTDWSSPTAITEANCISYIKTVIPQLEKLPYVARYSWYCGTMPGGSDVLRSAALFYPDNTLTEVGKTYRNPNYVPTRTVANGTYKIVGLGSGDALDVADAHTVNGSTLDIQPYNEAPNQQWNVTWVGSGMYKIIGVQSRLCLEVLGQSTATGAEVDINGFSGGSNQLWYIVPESNGYFSVINVLSGKTLDVAGGSTASGALIDIWDPGKTNAQQWAFRQPKSLGSS